MKFSICIDESKIKSPIKVEEVIDKIKESISSVSSYGKWLDDFWDGKYGDEYADKTVKELNTIIKSIDNAITYEIEKE